MRQLLFALAVLALAASTPLSARAQTAPFEINVVLSLTGQNAFLGSQEQQSLQMIEKLTNSTGGIRGRSVKFVFADDQTNPEVDVQLTNALLSKKPAALLGYGIGASCKTVIPLVEKTGPVTFCFTPAFQPAPRGYVFSSSVSTYDTLSLAIKFFRERGLTRIAALTTSDATGQDVRQSLTEILALPENSAVQLAANEQFNVTDLSVAAQVAKIKGARPQALLVSATGTPFGTVLHGLLDAGFDVPVWTGNSNMTVDQMGRFFAILPKTLVFSTLVGMHPGIATSAPVHQAQTVYASALRASDARVTTGQNLSWDATMLVIDAYRHLGLNATAAQMHDYLEDLSNWAGINGLYDFRSGSQRGLGQSSMIVLQWDPAKRDFVPSSAPGGGRL